MLLNYVVLLVFTDIIKYILHENNASVVIFPVGFWLVNTSSDSQYLDKLT